MGGNMMKNYETAAVGRPDRTKTLRKIQQLNFAMIELGLYLNNQPKCYEALQLYDKVKLLHDDAKAQYEKCYGPLTLEGVNAKKDGWSWMEGPWPWEGECE